MTTDTDHQLIQDAITHGEPISATRAAALVAELEAMHKTAIAIADERSHTATELLIAQQEAAALYKEFHAVLTTIGGRLYTQGTGAKWQMDLLSFVRDERARLEKEYDNAA